MKIGYIRVSTQEQNTVRQEVLMESLSVDEVYIDRMSGKNAGRPELRRMLEYVRKGDMLFLEYQYEKELFRPFHASNYSNYQIIYSLHLMD